jgi:P pilus assembly chaperone PapD
MRVLLSCLLLLVISSKAMSSLLVTPSRISFDVRDRTQEVIVMNTSGETNSYVLEWTNQKQTSFGAYKVLEGEELASFPTAEQFIRFSPRRVTLRPGESQTVKLLVRRKKDMDASEYRSHLKFTALPNKAAAANKSEAPSSQSDGINIKLNLLLSYSIPVILRTENPESNAEVTEFVYEANKDGTKNGSVSVKISKPAANSLYGDFTVFYEVDGTSTPIGFLNGVNIFAENREFMKNISLVQALPSNNGKLRLEYKGRAEFADKLLAESTLAL